MKLKNRVTLASLVFSLTLVAVGAKARQSAEDPAVLAGVVWCRGDHLRGARRR